jgi:hypothetical protein
MTQHKQQESKITRDIKRERKETNDMQSDYNFDQWTRRP